MDNSHLTIDRGLLTGQPHFNKSLTIILKSSKTGGLTALRLGSKSRIEIFIDEFTKIKVLYEYIRGWIQNRKEHFDTEKYIDFESGKIETG